jgi:tubulin--tyrosine ligase-like protein 12
LKAIGLPESLHRILFAKLKFEDYDFSNFCKIVIEEDSELVNVVCTKEIKANAEVFMVDHAWTFKYEDALATLKENSKLVDRLWSLTEYCCDKLDLPDHEEKPEVKEPIEDVIARLDAEESVIYDLDDYGINSLKELPNKGVFPDRTEQLSLMDNGIINPNEIANNLVNLPNLKGLWMNRCPVVDACANFDSISELMPSC